MYAALLDLLRQIAVLDEEEEALIKTSFKPRTLAKGDFFLKTGEISQQIGFIQSGLVRYFVYKNEEESTFIFTKENEFIADYQSFNQNTPTIQTFRQLKIVNCWLLSIRMCSTSSITPKTGTCLAE